MRECDFYFSQKQADWFKRVDETWGFNYEKKYVHLNGEWKEYTEACRLGHYPICYNKYNDWVYLGKGFKSWSPGDL